MLDIRRIRSDYDEVKKAVESRGQGDFGIARAVELDEERRTLLAEVEVMKNKQNQTSKEIPKLKKAGEDTTAIMAEMKSLSEKIKEEDEKVKAVEAELRSTILGIPNTISRPNSILT